MITKDGRFIVMEHFFKEPYKEIHIRQLARETGLSSTGVIKIVKSLQKNRFLTTKRTANIERVMPDFDGKFLMMKRVYNLYSLHDCGLLEFLKDSFQAPNAIILFGSYSDGTDTEKSDIDIAIITKSGNIPDTLKYARKLSRRINIHLVNLTKSSANFRNSLANGIVLEGFAELVK